MPARLDLSGQTFGKLSVESFAGVSKGKAVWNCKCSCGNRIAAKAADLRAARVRCSHCLTTPVNKTPRVRVMAWQSLLGPELTEQLIREAHSGGL